MEAALKSWVFPSPVVTPVLSSSNTDAHWAPFSLQTLNSHFGGSNNHIKRLHLVSVHIGASTIAEPRSVYAHVSSAHHEALTRGHSYTTECPSVFSERWML